jgi:hypothetical protein
MAKSILTLTTDRFTIASGGRCRALSVLGLTVYWPGTESLQGPSEGHSWVHAHGIKASGPNVCTNEWDTRSTVAVYSGRPGYRHFGW